MKNFLKYWPIVLILTITGAYYWRLFRGEVPFPGDLLIGAYLPWLEYKWGNVVGVAIKNTLISDIFSQFFLWKNEIARNYLQGQWPLWNPYSYSGYPLLANFNSGALNPLNILLVIFGSINGWSLFVVTQSIGSALAMYFYLRLCKREKISAVIAATIYAFGGFSILWSQFVNVGTAMIWIPLILAVIEKTTLMQESKWLLWISPLFLLMVLAGHLQALIYTVIISLGYFIYRVGLKNRTFILTFCLAGILAIGMSALQLLPTIELMNSSIRFVDDFSKAINYGLLPAGNIITLIAPDFFGNPSTGNFWGFFDYHETMTYLSILGFLGLTFSVFNFKKLQQAKFFAVLAVIALLMQFDNPIGRAIYLYKFPFLWTSVAGRINMVTLLSVSVIVAEMLDLWPYLSLRKRLKVFLPILAMIVLVAAIAYPSYKLYIGQPQNPELIQMEGNLKVGLRNLAMPTMLTFFLLGTMLWAGKNKVWKWLVLMVLLADLFRFGWKYIPFVPKSYIYPETEVLTFLKKDQSVFRIEKELGEILPQNTWTAYQLMSPSGYDPMAISEYVKAFSRDLNKVEHPGVTRFSEINTYDAQALGFYNVKYLLAIKRDREGKLGGNFYNHNIDLKDWQKVLETKEVAVLQNKRYQERARLLKADGSPASGSAQIEIYGNNKIVINFKNLDGDRLLLTDTYFPGWTVTVNQVPEKITKEVVPFRTVNIKGLKEGQVVFEYKPRSFYVGLGISLASFMVWLGWYFWNKSQA